MQLRTPTLALLALVACRPQPQVDPAPAPPQATHTEDQELGPRTWKPAEPLTDQELAALRANPETPPEVLSTCKTNGGVDASGMLSREGAWCVSKARGLPTENPTRSFRAERVWSLSMWVPQPPREVRVTIDARDGRLVELHQFVVMP